MSGTTKQTTQHTPEQIVDAFIASIERMDLEGGLALLADDVEYDNVPIGKVHGVEQVRATLAPFLAQAAAIEWKVLHQAASGDTVMNERVDRFQLPKGWMDLPVAGLFVVREGKIALWRDYFDLAAFRTAMAAVS